MTAAERDRMDRFEEKLDGLTRTVNDNHVNTIREIRDVIEKALDRHTANCPMTDRVEKAEEDITRLEGLQIESSEKSKWDKTGPWLLVVLGFTLGALVVSGVIPAEALSTIIPF